MSFFENALPVWLCGKVKEKNVTAAFYTAVDFFGGTAVLRVATSGFYRVFVNGEFVTFGPARCAHGFFRVDETKLELEKGVNHIAVEVVNYYTYSYASLRQDGFVQMELSVDGKAVAATGRDGFVGFVLNERLSKIQRYSYQRPMGESYRLSGDVYGWRVGRVSPNAVKTDVEILDEKQLMPRGIAPLKFPTVSPEYLVSEGNFITGVKPLKYKKDRSLYDAGDLNKYTVDGFSEDELEIHLSDETQEWEITEKRDRNEPFSGEVTVSNGEFQILSLPSERTGFIAFDIECSETGVFYIAFDETLRPNGDVDPNSMQCLNAVRFEVESGQYRFQTVEAVGFKYIKFACTNGRFVIKNIRVIELVCPQPIITEYKGSDPELAEIFSAAVNTFKQTAVDIFMDCPTRERAGWLCDSFFTARTEFLLTGDNAVERNFLENFLLPESFENLPKGMLPMCYPADFVDGSFIPNWAMWFVLELEDYLCRTGDEQFVLRFKSKIYDLLQYFKGFENQDGLLEKLENWVFVEWSKANDFVQDINYPTNMLYSRMLKAAAKLFDDEKLAEKGERLAEVILKRSFDGEFFHDNEVYVDGKPQLTNERSETCQYYAFFMGIATAESHPKLWNRLLSEFGPDRAEKGTWPEIWPSNAFVGNYMRLELLRQNGLYRQLLDECVGYFGYMARKTGTLWENTYDRASCNHGFASYAARFVLEAEKNLGGK